MESEKFFCAQISWNDSISVKVICKGFSWDDLDIKLENLDPKMLISELKIKIIGLLRKKLSNQYLINQGIQFSHKLTEQAIPDYYPLSAIICSVPGDL